MYGHRLVRRRAAFLVLIIERHEAVGFRIGGHRPPRDVVGDDGGRVGARIPAAPTAPATTLEHRKGSQTNRKQGKDGKRVVVF